MIWIFPIFMFFLTLVGEWLHTRRIRRLGRLAFGPTARPRRWTALVPVLRVITLTAIAWAMVALFTLKPKQFKEGDEQIPTEECRRLLFLLDVSPSMVITVAGEDGRLTRRRRVHELVGSIMERAVTDQCLMSVVAFYTGALPVVENCRDPEIVRNIMDELPLEYAFQYGKTMLIK